MKMLSQIFNETFEAMKILLFVTILILLLPFRVFVWTLYAIAHLISDAYKKYKGDK